jgi:tetratricopeptide (TPR) repeat protein
LKETVNTPIQSTAKSGNLVPNARPAAAVAAGSWFEANRALVLRLSVALVAVVLAAVCVSVWANNQSAKAAGALSDALDVYDTPLAQADQPAPPGVQTFHSAAERGKAAYPLFEQAANKYGLFQAGKDALYFAGLTAADMGDNAKAEAELKKAADASAKGTGALAKLALANLYRQTGRQAQAVSLYQELIAKPTTTVPAAQAKLQLAAMYEPSEPEKARKLYAEIKDSEKNTAAAQIATQKLGGGGASNPGGAPANAAQ